MSTFQHSTTSNVDAVNAAALDDRYDTMPLASSVSTDTSLDESLEDTRRVFNESTQQTNDTKFLDANDVLKGLAVGTMTLLTGGLGGAVLPALGVAGAATVGASSERRTSAAALNEQKASEFRQTAADFHKANVNENIARMNMAGRQATGGSTGLKQAYQMLTDMSHAPAEQFLALQEELGASYPALKRITQDGLKAGYHANILSGNFTDIMEMAQYQIDAGNPEAALDILGSKYNQLTMPKKARLLDTADPYFQDVNNLLTNGQVDSKTKSMMLSQLQFLKATDYQGYTQFMEALRSIPNDADALKQQFAARLDFMLENPNTGDPEVDQALRTVRVLIGTAMDPSASILGDPNTMGMIQRGLDGALQVVLKKQETTVPPPSNKPGTVPSSASLDQLLSTLDPQQQEAINVISEPIQRMIQENPMLQTISGDNAIRMILDALLIEYPSLQSELQNKPFQEAFNKLVLDSCNVSDGAANE